MFVVVSALVKNDQSVHDGDMAAVAAAAAVEAAAADDDFGRRKDKMAVRQ